MDLVRIVNQLNLISPLNYAEEWDNVGLILKTNKKNKIKKILLTIDLTEKVLKEAIKGKYNLIITYHPILFIPISQINPDNYQDKIILKLIKNDISVYSPHTALDNVDNGINDWLIRSSGEGEISKIPHPIHEFKNYGRVIRLKKSVSINILSERIKKYLKINYLRIASTDRKIKVIACAAGSGYECLKNVTADCYLTGEMKHHDILSVNRKNVNVILSEHTHTERGFLPHYKKNILKALGKEVVIHISKCDADPIKLK